MKDLTYGELTEMQRGMISAAEQAMQTAYCPYSGFSVGAALLTHDGEIVTGSNVENAAYGSTICAERAALVRANAMGRRTFKSIAVTSRGTGSGGKDIAAPCGACRQMLFEAAQVAGADIEVILASADKSRIVSTSVNELLPLGFGPKNLGANAR